MFQEIWISKYYGVSTLGIIIGEVYYISTDGIATEELRY
jgi:hypothetical protein